MSSAKRLPGALTTTALISGLPWMMAATFLIWPALAREEPPNFATIIISIHPSIRLALEPNSYYDTLYFAQTIYFLMKFT